MFIIVRCFVGGGGDKFDCVCFLFISKNLSMNVLDFFSSFLLFSPFPVLLSYSLFFPCEPQSVWKSMVTHPKIILNALVSPTQKERRNPHDIIYKIEKKTFMSYKTRKTRHPPTPFSKSRSIRGQLQLPLRKLHCFLTLEDSPKQRKQQRES